MEVRFFLTSQDVWNFQKYAIRRTRALVPLLFILVIVISLAVFSLVLSPSFDSLTGLFAILLFLVILIGLLFIVLRQRLRSGASSTLALQGEITIAIRPEGYHYRSNVSTSMSAWRAVKTITADTYNLYFILHSNRLVGQVIPRRAFATPQDAETFLALAQTYWANGQAAPPAGPVGTSVPYERWN